MPIIAHNPAALFPRYRNYSHAVEVTADSRLLFISGLNGYLKDGTSMPETFEAQAEIIWQHIGATLKSADMEYGNIVSLRTYLADPQYDQENVRLRVKYLGDNQPALTVICCRLLESKWKLEIEAVAAA
ncbi:RidA family protein [Exilibacterium tricleocarpae]|uniref:RidA family protein n=1 Tax=Exilibacterium tricleocarpae TaxID=2591008 RepID=A0A545TVQ7_9GAMM|nr:RidA family protein [Exilibacterium tricleocarpae]TQV81307.1 RidA family protein [Exilibacterium tricleocarpae]